jgi:hypothetical protein
MLKQYAGGLLINVTHIPEVTLIVPRELCTHNCPTITSKISLKTCVRGAHLIVRVPTSN